MNTENTEPWVSGSTKREVLKRELGDTVYISFERIGAVQLDGFFTAENLREIADALENP